MKNVRWDWDPEYRDAQRGLVTLEIELATGESLSTIDPLPDSLMSRAMEIGIAPVYLLMWIEEQRRDGDWSAEAMRAWARENGALTPDPCADPPAR